MGKMWNKNNNNWEVDGEPCTYRVTWKEFGSDEVFERIFDDVDQGYDYYEMKRKSIKCHSVTWDHLPY